MYPLTLDTILHEVILEAEYYFSRQQDIGWKTVRENIMKRNEWMKENLCRFQHVIYARLTQFARDRDPDLCSEDNRFQLIVIQKMLTKHTSDEIVGLLFGLDEELRNLIIKTLHELRSEGNAFPGWLGGGEYNTRVDRILSLMSTGMNPHPEESPLEESHLEESPLEDSLPEVAPLGVAPSEESIGDRKVS